MYVRDIAITVKIQRLKGLRIEKQSCENGLDIAHLYID